MLEDTAKIRNLKVFFSNSSKNGGYRNILALEDFISSLSDVRTSCSGTDGIARRVNLFYASHRF